MILDDNESSIVDSDLDLDSDSDSDIDVVINRIDHIDQSISALELLDKNLNIPNYATNDTKPSISSVAVQNSTDITFGNKTFYNGPVTIKQFIFDKTKWKKTDPSEFNNSGYASSSSSNSITHKLNQIQNGTNQYINI